jgi:DNA-binding transcriptional ArsR family regulator
MEIAAPQQIKALTHPLRLDLLELLAVTGPATAARCGRALGVPQANCSFHLRQLAKYGFVEDGGPGGDRRERVWRLPEVRPTLRVPPGADSVLEGQLRRVVVEREAQAILAWAERRDQESPQWRDKATVMTAVAVLSPEDALEIKDKWMALLEPYLARTAAESQLGPGQRHVRYFMAATPIADLDPEDENNDSSH